MPASPKACSSAPCIPAGTSRVAGIVPTRAASSGSGLVPTRRTGRVCGTGAGKAPSPKTISTPSRAARATTSAMNRCQRMSGSGPWSIRTLRPVRLVAPSSRSSGQRSSVSTPLTMRSTGRRARWSISSSASKLASGSWAMDSSSVDMATDDAWPASTHPSMATTRTGRSSVGQPWRVTRSLTAASSVGAGTGRLSEGGRSRLGCRFAPRGRSRVPATQALGGGPGLRPEQPDRVRVAAVVEAVPSHGPGNVTGVHALQDARQLPVCERHVEVQLLEGPARRRRVAFGDLLAGVEPLRRGGGVLQRRLLARLGPVHEQLAHVGQHVTERAELPVEDGGDGAVGADDRVVEPVVPVDDAGRTLLGDPGDQPVVHGVDVGDVRAAELVAGALVLAVPPLQLTGDVTLLAGQVAESHGVRVDLVQRDERVDEGG